MKLSKLNESLTLIANLGVIAGIIFLAVEVQLNTNMMRAQTRDAVTGKQLEWYAVIAGDSETMDVYFRGINSPEDIDPNSSDQTRFNMLMIGNFRIWENEWYQFKQGLFDQDEFDPRLEVWSRMLRQNKGLSNVWKDQRLNYSPEFREQVDQLVADAAR